jgi:hypothetical protein
MLTHVSVPLLFSPSERVSLCSSTYIITLLLLTSWETLRRRP